MKQEEITRLLQELELPKYKYLYTSKIKSIKLKSGREIKLDWESNRISFLDKGLQIRYGHSEYYGDRILNTIYVSATNNLLICATPEKKIKTISFREPKELDVLVTSERKKIISQAYITRIERTTNQVLLYLSKEISPIGYFSFYNPEDYITDGSCSHGTEIEGVYLKFKPNLESISKKEIVHEKINYKKYKRNFIRGRYQKMTKEQVNTILGEIKESANAWTTLEDKVANISIQCDNNLIVSPKTLQFYFDDINELVLLRHTSGKVKKFNIEKDQLKENHVLISHDGQPYSVALEGGGCDDANVGRFHEAIAYEMIVSFNRQPVYTAFKKR